MIAHEKSLKSRNCVLGTFGLTATFLAGCASLDPINAISPTFSKPELIALMQEKAEPELLALLTDDEIALLGRDRKTRISEWNIDKILRQRILPETEPKPDYPAEVETFKDCEDCPTMAVIPEGSFNRRPPLIPGARYFYKPIPASDCREDPKLAATFEHCGYEIPEGANAEELLCKDWLRHDNGALECTGLNLEGFPYEPLPTEPDIINVSSFAMATTEVTRGQFRKFVEETGYETSLRCWQSERSESERSIRYVTWNMIDHIEADSASSVEQTPVTCIDYQDAAAYAAWLSSKTGQRYRLPSHLEWQYAARAGSETPYWWGWRKIGDREQFEGKFAPVGRHWPSPFGLYDMNGNVMEWVSDCALDGDERDLITLQPYIGRHAVPGPISAGLNTWADYSIIDGRSNSLLYSRTLNEYPPTQIQSWREGFWRKDGKKRNEPSACSWRAIAGAFAFDTAYGWYRWMAVRQPRINQSGQTTNEAKARHFGFRIVRDLN